jgi:hypothetical protein
MEVKDYQEVVNKVNSLLDENIEWIDRYKSYAEKLLEHKNLYTPYILNELKKLIIDVGYPLTFHSTITSILKNEIFLMYRGLKVLKVKVSTQSKLEIYIVSGDNDVQYSFDDDNYNTIIRFAKSIIQNKNSYKTNPEFAVESSLKNKIRKHKDKEIDFKNFAPIAILESKQTVFQFQMPIPISASKIYSHESIVTYSKNSRPGIDLMARSKRYNKKSDETTLCIIEIKDSYQMNERPELAIKQAIAYATFIGRLLRTPNARNDIWYSLFRGNIENYLSKGYIEKLSKPIDIRTFIAMPLGNYETDLSFKNISLTFNKDNSNDRIILDYMVLKLDSNQDVLAIEHSK